MPLISVVIAAHNYGCFLTEAIQSVQSQTFTDWECIIVDDVSTDNTPEIAAELMREDARIRYILNPHNLGEAGSRNVGNAAASGELIASLDADDWWHPDKLRLQWEKMQETPDSILCFTSTVRVKGDHHEKWLVRPEWRPKFDLVLRHGCVIPHSSVLIRREAFEAVGGYNDKMPYAVDWDLWLRLLDRYGEEKFVWLDEHLVYYRLHGDNMTAKWRSASRGEWIAVRKLMLRRGWAIKHPVKAWQVLDAQFSREIIRCEEAGLRNRAFLFGCAQACLAPIRRWRWLAALQLLSIRQAKTT